MWNRGARSSALERAQAQLSGRKLVNTVPEPWEAKRSTSSLDGVAKTALQTRQTSFQDLSDLSSEGTVSHDIIRPTAARRLGKREHPSPPPPAPESSGVGAGGGSRFLKKAPPAAASSLSPALSKTQHHEPRYVASSQRSSQSTALSRLALIEDRIRNRQQARDRPPSSAPNRGSTPGPAAQETPLSLSAQSSSDLSMKGKRFLKTKTPTTTATTLATATNAPTVAPKGPEASFKAGTPLGGSKASPVAVANRGVTLDSDEEDMRQLLGGSFESPEDSLLTDLRGASQNIPRKSFRKGTPKISPSPPSVGRASSARRLSRSPPSSLRGSPDRLGFSSRPQAPPSPSLSPLPRSPEGPFPGRTGSLRSRPLRRSLSSASDRSDVRSLEELFPEALGSLAELHPEALGSLAELHPEALGSLAELYPEALDSDDAISEQSGVSDDFKIKVMSLDDLAPVTLGDTERPAKKKTETQGSQRGASPRPREEEPSEEAQEEGALSYESDFESGVRTEEDASANDISEHLGDEEETSEGKQRPVSDSDRSHGRYADYSHSLSERRSQSRSRSYDGQDSRADDESQSDSTISRASTSPSGSDSSSRTVAPPRRSQTRPPGPVVRETASQTQPDGLTYAWSSGFASLGSAVGMAYVDPTPVASHTVSAEAVEALSAYSPAVFALNDMLREQLSLTRHYVQANRYLHSSLLQSLEPADYTYTTLEGTKEFIRCHKPPRLTLEEALEEVLQEMRDYHYI